MAMRRPTGEIGVGCGARWASAASALSRVVSRGWRAGRPARARRAPCPLRGRVRAEARLELGREPFGKVARDMSRRAGEVAVASRSRSASVSGDGAWPSPVNSAAIAAISSPRVCFSAPSDFGARRRLAHEPRRRAFAPQRVVNESGDRGAVARAGEAVRKAPVLHRIGRGPATGLDVGQNFDGGGDAGGGDHGRRVGRGNGSAATDRNPFVRRRRNVTGSADRSRYRARRQPDYSHW